LYAIFPYRNRNRNKFINQIRAPGGHMQITIMIDTQQQYIKLNIRGEISVNPALFHNFGCCYIILMGHKQIKIKMNNSI
jgi:hypothetical protein